MYICNFSAMDQRHFLCYFILTSWLVAGQTPQYGLLGREATLTPSIPAQPEQILWKHDGDKVAEFDGSKETVYRTYKNRITLDRHSAEITIKDLQHEDSGEYELEAIINNKVNYARHEVIVIDEVAQPTISCVMNHGNDSNKSEPRATLLCSFDLGHHPSVMKFDWGSLGESQGGRELNISLQGRHDDSVYTCRLTNPLSAKNATFTAKDCYPGLFAVAGQTPQYGLLGREATLTPSIPAQPEQILWKHDGDKVAEFDGREETVYRTYKNRITLDWHSAEITIKDLQHEDSGAYELEAIINNKVIYSRHKVIVIDEVAQPTISCVMNHGNDSPHATLLCSSDLGHSPPVMEFDWGSLGESQGSQELNISLQGRQDDSVYTCRVTNPLSAKNASFTAKDCYPDKSSSVGLIAGLVVGLLLLVVLICVGLWIYCRRQHHKAQPNIETGDMRRTSSHSRTTEETQGLVDDQTNSPNDFPETGNVKEKAKRFEDLNLHGSGDKHGDHWKKTQQREEEQLLLDTSASSSRPQLHHSMDQIHPNTEPEDPANKTKEDQVTPTEQKLPDSDSWGKNKPDSDGEVRDFAEDKQSDPPLSATLEQPETQGLVDDQTNSPDDSPEKGNVKEKTKRIEDLNLHGSGDKHGDRGMKTHQREEGLPLFDTSATLPSPQRLHGMDQSHPNIEPEDPAYKPKEDQVTVTPTEQKLPDSESRGKNKPDSDGEVRDFAEDKQSDPPLSATPEQPGSETNASNDDEETSDITLASSQSHSPLTQNDVEPNEDVDTEQVSGKPTEENIPESVSSGLIERNEPGSDGDLKGVAGENQADLQPSATPEQLGPQMTPPEQDPNPSQEEPNGEDTMESYPQKDHSAVSEAENDSDKVSDLPEALSNLKVEDKPNTANTNQDPPLDTSIEEDPNTTDPQEGKTAREIDFDESGGDSQADLCSAEAEKGDGRCEVRTDEEKGEIQPGPNEKEADSDGPIEVNKEQNKGEVFSL